MGRVEAEEMRRTNPEMYRRQVDFVSNEKPPGCIRSVEPVKSVIDRGALKILQARENGLGIGRLVHFAMTCWAASQMGSHIF